MKTIKGETVEYDVEIDARGMYRRAVFPPIMLGNACKWCGKRPCGCRA